jgi:hypothetical protein
VRPDQVPLLMQTKNVFLDTSAIIGQNFDYEGPSLKALGDLAASGRAHLVTTPITIGEVESKIRSRIAKARVATERFKQHAILKNLRDPAFDSLLGKADVLATADEKLIKQLHDFLARTNTEIVPLSEASTAEVFEKYFKGQPPFGEAEDTDDDADSEGAENKKKQKVGKNRKGEFPDAFVISALEGWCKKNGEKLYVVSSDSDFEEHCKQSANLIRLARPGEFVNEFSNLDPDLRAVETSAQRNISAFQTAISAEFQSLGFYLDDQDGDVSDVRVEEVELLDELSLLGVVGMVATFEVTAKVTYLADVSYDDPDSVINDGDGNYIALHTVDTEIERSEEFTVTVDVVLDARSNFVKVSAVRFPPGDIAITAIEHDYYN